MGKKFSVESQKDLEHFLVNVNVDEWCDKVKQVNTLDGKTVEIDDWTFESMTIDDRNSEDGTTIVVTDLKEDVKALFGNEDFLNSLYVCITKMLCFSLIKGMKITLNNKTLTANCPELFISENSKPYFIEEILMMCITKLSQVWGGLVSQNFQAGMSSVIIDWF